MRQKSMPEKEPATQVVKNIRRATRRHFSAEDKIRIVLEGLRGEDTIGMAHPFHVHGALFRILSIEGQSPPAHLAGWKDTILVEDKAVLLVAFNQLATREHPFMYHCHILEHEDAGLMGQYICS